MRRSLPRLAVPAAVAAIALAAGCVESNRGLLQVDAAADSVVVLAGNGQTAYTGDSVVTVPVVVVKDVNGFRVPGVRVTFTPATGAGSVANTTVLTDSAGRASPGAWIVGADSGSDTLYASVTGLPTARHPKAAIVAHVVDLCNITRPYVIGTTITDTIAGPGCRSFDGGVVKPYQFRVDTLSFVAFTATASAFTPMVEVVSATDNFPVALADTALSVAGKTLAYLAPGTYRVRAGAFVRPAAGPFTLATAPATLTHDCTQTPFISKGTALNGSLAATDCQFTVNLSTYAGGVIAQPYAIFLRQTDTLTVSLASSAFDTVLLLANGGQQLIGFSDNLTTPAGTTNSGFTFSPAAAGLPGGLYFLIAASKGTTGTYALTISP